MTDLKQAAQEIAELAQSSGKDWGWPAILRALGDTVKGIKGRPAKTEDQAIEQGKQAATDSRTTSPGGIPFWEPSDDEPAVIPAPSRTMSEAKVCDYCDRFATLLEMAQGGHGPGICDRPVTPPERIREILAMSPAELEALRQQPHAADCGVRG